MKENQFFAPTIARDRDDAGLAEQVFSAYYAEVTAAFGRLCYKDTWIAQNHDINISHALFQKERIACRTIVIFWFYWFYLFLTSWIWLSYKAK